MHPKAAVDTHDHKVAALAERAEKLGDAEVQALAAAARTEQDELYAAVDALQRKVEQKIESARRPLPVFD